MTLPTAVVNRTDMTVWFCQCDGSCGEIVKIPDTLAKRILVEHLVLISRNCPNGSSSLDRWLEDWPGYQLYRETPAPALRTG